VKVAGVDIVDIPSTLVVPLRIYDTHDPVGILFAVPTIPAVSPDGVDTCDGHVVPTERDSIGSARLFTKAYVYHTFTPLKVLNPVGLDKGDTAVTV
jgi:hypothetical protein